MFFIFLLSIILTYYCWRFLASADVFNLPGINAHLFLSSNMYPNHPWTCELFWDSAHLFSFFNHAHIHFTKILRSVSIFLISGSSVLTFFSSTASSYVQSFEQIPTHSRNIILRGKGFSPAVFSKESCRATNSEYATRASFCTKFTWSECFSLFACIFYDWSYGKYEL